MEVRDKVESSSTLEVYMFLVPIATLLNGLLTPAHISKRGRRPPG